ncbi:MAG: sigma-70 family RNA polymerase sigma factor [Planctomycetota bacterium]
MPAVEADLDLLRRYIDADDAEAFAQLVRRHTSLVYFTCLRVLGDRERAEDAAQETFQRLMRHPEKVSHSLSAWLHRVATRHSIDVLRSDTARRRRERAYQDRLERRRKPAEPWSDVSAQVDEALAKLGDAERAMLVEHFMRGRSQAELAREAGVSKATMCRRMEAALAALRKRMGGTAALGVGTLVGAWTQHASAAAPETLTLELSKMALVSGSGFGATSTAATLKTWPLVALGGTMGVAAVALIALAVIGLTRQPPAESEPHKATAAIRAAINEDPEVQPPGESGPGLIYLREPGTSLRSDHVVAYSIEDDTVTLVFGDTHVTTLPIDEARPLIETQAGATLEQLAARSRNVPQN